MKTICLFLAMLVIAGRAGAADALTEKLQRGLFEEEANHNLNAAIKEYQTVVAQSDEQRKVIATALFRLGECYRKLGRTNEANGQYQRLLRDFSEQEQLVSVIRESRIARPSAEGRVDSPGMSELERQEARLRLELSEANARLDALHKLPREKLLDAALLSSNDGKLAALQEQLRAAGQKLASAGATLGAEHPEMQRLTEVRQTILEQRDNALQGFLFAQKNRTVALFNEWKAAQTEIQRVAGTITQAEAEELARVKSLAQNSPDLLQSSGPDGFSQLHRAAMVGHYNVVEFILSFGVNPNGTERRPPLTLAAERGHLRIVQLLLDKGADVNAGASFDQTSLMGAAHGGFRSLVELLLDRGADVNRVSDDGLTALHYAAFRGHTGIAELLLKRGSNPDVLSRNQRTIQTQVGGVGYQWSSFSYSGASPLHLAAEGGSSALVELLLRHGASATITNFALTTPLHLAARGPMTNICSLLLDKGAKVHAEDRDGRTPFSTAIESGQPEVVALLLAKGADVNRPIALKLDPSAARSAGRQFNVIYPLHIAVPKGRATLDVLLAAKPALEVTNSNGQTPVIQAVRAGTDIVESLLKAGADPNHATAQWGAPLLLAASDEKAAAVVEALLKHEANPNILNSSGETPLSLAQFNQRRAEPEIRANATQVERLLREYGANENLQRLFAMDYTRPSWTVPAPKLFSRGTNDYNRYTLFEFLAAVFSQGRNTLAFPDLAHVTIERLEGTNAKPKELALNIEEILRANDCSKDLWLEWGDRMSIPELDHPLNESWAGLSRETVDLLTRCLTRRVQIIVKQETNTVKLMQSMSGLHAAPPGVPGASLPGSFQVELVTDPVPAPKDKPEKTIPSFRLKDVVYGANILRASSDPTRVRVTRPASGNQKANTWTIDLTKVNASREGGGGRMPSAYDLWLRDGDVIEIPEKQ